MVKLIWQYYRDFEDSLISKKHLADLFLFFDRSVVNFRYNGKREEMSNLFVRDFLRLKRRTFSCVSWILMKHYDVYLENILLESLSQLQSLIIKSFQNFYLNFDQNLNLESELTLNFVTIFFAFMECDFDFRFEEKSEI